MKKSSHKKAGIIDYIIMAVLLAAVIGIIAFPASDRNFFENLADSFVKNFILENRWTMIMQGVGTTCMITVLAGLFGTILAFLICLLRRTGSALANRLFDIFVRLMQGTPIVIILMILYYVILGRFGMNAVWAAVIGFTLHVGAYGSEIMRSAIDGIDRGQREAALALGFSERQAFFRFVFPEAAVHFLPVYRGELISLLKGTAIAGYISVQDLTKMSDLIQSRTSAAFFPLLAAALIYFLLEWLISQFIKLLLVRLDRKAAKRSKGKVR